MATWLLIADIFIPNSFFDKSKIYKVYIPLVSVAFTIVLIIIWWFLFESNNLVAWCLTGATIVAALMLNIIYNTLTYYGDRSINSVDKKT
jgi:4-hydroxybenzoate polyprenyltransferase